MMRKKYILSIKNKMAMIVIGMLIPLIMALIFYNIYIINILNDKIAESNKNTLNLYSLQLETELEAISKTLVDIVANDHQFRALAYKQENMLDLHDKVYSIKEKYASMINTYPVIGACMLISPENNLNKVYYSSNISGLYLKETITNYFKELAEQELVVQGSGWISLELKEKQFLYVVRGYKNVYSICLIDLDSFDLPQDDLNTTEKEVLVFYNHDILLTEKGIVRNNNIFFTGSADYYFSGSPQKYMIIEDELGNTDLRVAYIIPYNGIFENLNKSQYIIFMGTILSILFIPFGYLLLKKTFFKPIDKLMYTMEEIKSGNMEAEVDEEYRDVEFIKVNETFNNMIKQIKDFRIESYEKALKMRWVRLQYYQIQIRPHFYLNCLKSLYGLAQGKDYERIQKVIILLSKHLRYMMREKEQMVTIGEELEYVRNYIVLQQLSLAYPPKCMIDIEESLTVIKIPAISILTFVENSVKHCLENEEGVEIRIKVQRLQSETGNLINITISDNGKGFPDEQLQAFNYSKADDFSEECIGIRNVIQRFYLIWGEEKAGFAFSNAHGANVDIFLQLDEQE